MEIVSIDFYTAVVPYSLSLFVDAPVCFQIGLSESESSYASFTVCVVVWPLTNVLFLVSSLKEETIVYKKKKNAQWHFMSFLFFLP